MELEKFNGADLVYFKNHFNFKKLYALVHRIVEVLL